MLFAQCDIHRRYSHEIALNVWRDVKGDLLTGRYILVNIDVFALHCRLKDIDSGYSRKERDDQNEALSKGTRLVEYSLQSSRLSVKLCPRML